MRGTAVSCPDWAQHRCIWLCINSNFCFLMYAQLGARKSPGTGLRELCANQIQSGFNRSGQSGLLARISLASMADASSSCRRRGGVILTQLTLLLVPPSWSQSLPPSHLFPPPLLGARLTAGALVKGRTPFSHVISWRWGAISRGFFWRVTLPDCLPCQNGRQFIFQWSKKPRAPNVNGVACSSTLLSLFWYGCYFCEAKGELQAFHLKVL